MTNLYKEENDIMGRNATTEIYNLTIEFKSNGNKDVVYALNVDARSEKEAIHKAKEKLEESYGEVEYIDIEVVIVTGKQRLKHTQHPCCHCS
jgi:ribosomal protein L23